MSKDNCKPENQEFLNIKTSKNLQAKSKDWWKEREEHFQKLPKGQFGMLKKEKESIEVESTD